MLFGRGREARSPPKAAVCNTLNTFYFSLNGLDILLFWFCEKADHRNGYSYRSNRYSGSTNSTVILLLNCRNSHTGKSQS